MRLKNSQWSAWIYRSIRIAFALAIAGIISQIQVDYLEALFYDLRVAYKPISPKSGHVEIISIDAATLRELQKDPDANDHIAFLQALKKAEPRAVVYTFDPETITGDESQLKSFAMQTETLNSFYYGANTLPKPGHENQLKLKAPLDNIAVYPAPKTADLNIFAKDGVTRRFIFSFDGQPTLHTLLARGFNGREFKEDYRGIFDFIGAEQGYIDFRPTGTYPAKSFFEVMQGQFQPELYKDKVIFVGKDILETTKDYLKTPHSRDIVAMTNLEMHANILDTLILNRAPRLSGPWQDYILTALISILTVFVVLTLRPTRGLLILGTTVAGFILVCHVLFMAFGLWIEMTHPLLAIFICYYFFIPYRLIIENRRSWEYYQRNKLLTQVEELKSNFLRMMSHDLKTPLARIQGMLEIIMRKKDNLTDEQQRALRSIEDSSFELSEFIGSILNLGRIESKDIQLNLKSKDINSLLNNVVSKCQYLAERKHIEVKTEFEPMFSVKADEDLIKQVFTNLVENAIKYSPENSKILISTEERDGQVIVQVADQGRGIAKQDLPNIFTKFYRTPDAVQSDIGGSGLGLYLAKYFVELHNGNIDVESDLGQGSTFTVSLPLDH